MFAAAHKFEKNPENRSQIDSLKKGFELSF